MKKIILAVILLAAAGGGTYYLLQKKNQSQVTIINKELVFGKWKIDSLVSQKDSTKDGLVLMLFAMDSTLKDLVYNIQPDGKVFISLPSDTIAKKDTSSFSWGKGKEFLWKGKTKDPSIDTMIVVKLEKKEFVVETPDSTLIYLKRIE